MKNNAIGTILRKYRKKNALSIKEVCVLLEDYYDMKFAEKTIYGWESNQAHPTADTFVALCEIYKIPNISETFSNSKTQPKDFIINGEERIIIEKYRKHPELRDVVKRVLNIQSGFQSSPESEPQK